MNLGFAGIREFSVFDLVDVISGVLVIQFALLFL